MIVRGFTLTELLVVLTIVGLLGMITYPSYAAYVTRTRRSEGQIALLEVMQQQERYFSQHNRYLAFSAGASDPEARRLKWWSGDAPQSSAYELSGAACPGQRIEDCIEIRAEPGTARVRPGFQDRECGTLRITSSGDRQPQDRPVRCWP